MSLDSTLASRKGDLAATVRRRADIPRQKAVPGLAEESFGRRLSEPEHMNSMEATRRDVLALAAAAALGAWPASAQTASQSDDLAGRAKSGGARRGLGARARPLLRPAPARPRLAGDARALSPAGRLRAQSRRNGGRDQCDAGGARRFPHALLHAGGARLLPARRHFLRRARASGPGARFPARRGDLSGDRDVHPGRRPRPHVHNRGGRGRARPPGRPSARRRNPVRGWRPVPAGGFLPRQGRGRCLA